MIPCLLIRSVEDRDLLRRCCFRQRDRQRLVRWLGWSLEEYQDWFGRTAERLLVSDPHASTTPDRPDGGP